MAHNPLSESISTWPKIARLIAALFLSAGQAVLGFTLLFRTVYFPATTLNRSAHTLIRYFDEIRASRPTSMGT